MTINSLAPGIYFHEISDSVFSKSILVINGWGISCEIVLCLFLLDLKDNNSNPLTESVLSQTNIMVTSCHRNSYWIVNYWPFVWLGIQHHIQFPLTGCQWCETVMFPLLLAWIGWTNSWVACGLRCHDMTLTWCHCHELVHLLLTGFNFNPNRDE